MAKEIRIVFSGGGSMGHVTPALLVYRELKKTLEAKGYILNSLYIGRNDAFERQAVEKYNMPYVAIQTGKLRRYLHWRHLVDPFLVLVGFFQAFFAIVRFRPHYVFLKGGYVTVPVAVAAKVLKIPMMAHESDSVIGLANKIVSRLGASLALGFPLDVYATSPAQSFFSGNPVRIELTEQIVSRETLDHQYGFYRNRPMILIMGGSQGSLRINTLVQSLLPVLLEKYVVIHSTGVKGYEGFEQLRDRLSPTQRDNYFVAPYIHETLGNFLAHADLVISRAGAGSISEILRFKKPAIFIPLSVSAGGIQQMRNAEFLKKNNLASVLEEGHLTPEKLLNEIEYMIEDGQVRESIEAHISDHIPHNSAEIIAERIIREMGVL